LRVGGNHAGRRAGPDGRPGGRSARTEILVLGAAAALALLAGGCAYSFSGTNLPGYIKSIAIPNVENGTLQPNLGDEVTSGMIDRYIKDGRLRIAAANQANCLLEAKVHNYNADQTAQDYVVVLTVSAVLRDQVKSRELWKDDAITHTAIYSLTGAAGTLASEDAARAQDIQDLATDLISRTLEEW